MGMNNSYFVFMVMATTMLIAVSAFYFHFRWLNNKYKKKTLERRNYFVTFWEYMR